MLTSRALGVASGPALARAVRQHDPLLHGKVPALFWPLACAALVIGTAISQGWLTAGSGWLLHPAIAAMLVGGLPHGACDISLAAAALRCKRREILPLIGLYILVAAAMAALWWLSPLAALLAFLAMSGFHFGEDWGMLPSALLRTMAGMTVITTAAFGQQDHVANLFVALTGSPHAVMVARWAEAAAPLTWLVTLVGLDAAWRTGHRAWVIAACTAFLALLLLPPLVGFTLFFAGLHAPLHWQAIQRSLPAARMRTAGQEGLWLTVLTLTLWLAWLGFAPDTGMLGSSAEAFRLLSVVAAPHLALSLVIARRIALLNTPAPPECAPPPARR